MNEIKLSELKTSDTISNLVPEMTEKEFLDLKTSISDNGLRHPIDINKDNTILDGRHRVRVFESLGYESIPFTRHDLSESEAISFVRDTAVERRNLTSAQRLNVILSAEDIVSEISNRAKENKRKAMEVAHKNNMNHQQDSYGSTEPQLSKPTPVNTENEIAKLAGVSRSSVVRAKKVKRENPEAYQKVVNGESTWSREYDNLPSVKNYKPKIKKEQKVVKKESPKKEPEDLRDVINDNAATGEEVGLLRAESDANHLIDLCSEINHLINSVKSEDLFERLVSTLDVSQVKEAIEKLKKYSK